MCKKDDAARASYYSKKGKHKALRRKKNWRTQIASDSIKPSIKVPRCMFPPGSDGKIDTLTDRFSKGLDLFQPEDITWEQVYENSR